MKRYDARISAIDYLREKLQEAYTYPQENKLLIRASHAYFWKDPRLEIDSETYRKGIPYNMAQDPLPRIKSFSVTKKRKDGKSSVQIYSLYAPKDNPHCPDGVLVVHCRDIRNTEGATIERKSIIHFITARI